MKTIISIDRPLVVNRRTVPVDAKLEFINKVESLIQTKNISVVAACSELNVNECIFYNYRRRLAKSGHLPVLRQPTKSEPQPVAQSTNASPQAVKKFGLAPLTNAQFIQRGMAKHGDKYDYSKTQYVNAQTFVTITCKKHGDFSQRAAAHLVVDECCALCRVKAPAQQSQSIMIPIATPPAVPSAGEWQLQQLPEPMTIKTEWSLSSNKTQFITLSLSFSLFWLLLLTVVAVARQENLVYQAAYTPICGIASTIAIYLFRRSYNKNAI